MFSLGEWSVSGYTCSVPIDRTQLPEDASVLQQMVLDLIAQLDAEQSKRFKTEQLLRNLLAARTGRKSEQLTREQLALFAEELKAQGVNLPEERGVDDDNDNVPPSTGWHQHGQTAWPPSDAGTLEARAHRARSRRSGKALPRMRTRPAADGGRVERALRIHSGAVIVIEDVCKKYACNCTVKTAMKPSQPIEKSTAGAGLLTHVIVSKLPITCRYTGNRKCCGAPA